MGVAQCLAVAAAFVCAMLAIIGFMELLAWLIRPTRSALLEALFEGGSLWKP